MKLWLTKCRGGRYSLTFLHPLISKVRGTNHLDAFEAPGEPIGVRHLCEDGVRSLIGRTLPDLTPTRIELAGMVLPQPLPQPAPRTEVSQPPAS